MMNFLTLFLLSIKLKLQEFCTKEDGDVNVVSIVVLIGIAVLLAIIFKDAISELIESLLETITENAEDAVGA
jgi:hypothetical protein